MTEQTTVPAYGASIKIEEAKAGLYLREKALDAVQEQVLEDVNEALSALDGRRVIEESDFESLTGLLQDIRTARDLVEIATEIAFSKMPAEEIEE